MLLSVARHFSKVRYEVFADLSMETGCLISIPVIKIILATKYSMHCFLHLRNGCNNKNFTIELERIREITVQPQTQ